MEDSFNIYLYSDDANFSSSLAVECNNYGFGLIFFDDSNMEEVLNDDNSLISVVIVDLSSQSVNPYKLGYNARISSNLRVFGVLERFNKKDQLKEKENSFDLVFTKKMLLRSIKEVVIHISDNE